MLSVRSSGVLCHITSLPSEFAIGDLGPEAYHFVDFLSRAGQRWWQILPINPTDQALANSPYSSYSAFAMNPLLISPELLVKDGFLDKKDLDGVVRSTADRVDHAAAAALRAGLLAKAYQRYEARAFKLRVFDDFCSHQEYWLRDYALFMVLKRKFNDACWRDWPVEFRDRDTQALKNFYQGHIQAVDREKFIQYLVFRQWQQLQGYCSRKGVGIIGDIPIYVNYDSVDVWVRPDLFKLDGERRQTFVAGVPPDYFSEVGQRWGNPVYDWERLKATGFSWWIERVRHDLGLFDALRIDHFRAFAQCWEIPASEATAIRGAWRDVPGNELFKAIKAALPRLPIIAEDLGIITHDVEALQAKFGFPGMRVLMFAFHNEYKKSRDLPENYKPECLVYTGTHDNNTVRGWFENDITPIEKKNVAQYLGREITAQESSEVMIELALRSVASIAIISLQDLLGLGEEARMNRPSTVLGNWLWRFRSTDVGKDLARRLLKMTVRHGR